MTDDLVVKAKCEACQAAGIVALAIAPEYVLQLLSKIEWLQSGLSAIETRWRQASRDKCFRQHYRETMEQCADELRDLLIGFDDREIQAEIDKAAKELDL